MDSLPWWAFAGLAFLLMYHPEFQAAPWGSSRDARSNVDELQKRRLGDHPDFTIKERVTSTKIVKLPHIKLPDFNITVPCVTIPFVGQVAKPCGNVTIGGKGVDIKTLFGTKHIPGTNVLKPYVKKIEKSFEHYTVYVVGAIGAFYGLITLASASRRQQFVQNIKDTLAGKLDTPDPDEETKDAEEDAADKMDPKSSNFIAPGNIYRLLAVLHPGKIGYQQWGQFSFKAGVCAYMQLYLPFKIILVVFEEWSFHGLKSPLWFMSEGGAFVTMFISVGSLCNLFALKCSENIRIGAEANYYILTHKVATQGEATGYDPVSQDEAPTSPFGVPKIPMPKLPPMLITANEYFWCCLSLLCNIMMSFLLFFAMFVKIATFTGKMGDVAVVAVSLYFIFDLDDKVMDSDPKLRMKYRHAVIKQTVEKPYKPTWLLTIAAMSRGVLGMLTPLGLAAIVLFSWKSDNVIIGGDSF